MNFRPTERMVPLVLLLSVFAAFGLLIPWLGLYWDDWPVVYMHKTLGVGGFWDFYQYDRPFSAWTYIVFSPLLGDRPWIWQVFTLLLRWMTAVFVWLSLRIIWPRRTQQTFWVSLLFAVIPIFVLQYVSIAYSQHWICYLFYFASVYLMLKSLDGKRYSSWLMLLSVLFSAVQILTMEYFLGLELLRLVFLWMYLNTHQPDLKPVDVIKKLFRTFWAYMLILIVYVVWRVFFLEIPGGDPNQLVFPSALLKSPLQALLDLVQMALQDVAFLFTNWISAFTPANLDLHRPFSLAVLMAALAFGAGIWFFLSQFSSSYKEEKMHDHWLRYAFALGIIAILLGMLPVWMIGRQASVGPIGNRFSLAALFGVCVVIVGLLEWLSPRIKVKNVLISVLLVLAIHTNLFHAKDFQLSWEKQRSFYWQLFWRAPYIQPGTAFISDGEIFPFVGLYSTSMGISLLYPPVDVPQNVPYWFFSYWREIYRHPDEVRKGTLLEDGLRNYAFSGNSHDALIVYFAPENNMCLQILSMRDAEKPYVPDSSRGLLSVSNLSRISREPPSDGYLPPEDIFGAEPNRNWCYFYQKAELAYQYEEWDDVIQFMEDAKEAGVRPSDMQEYLPLLGAYLYSDDFESALKHSVRMHTLSDKIDDSVCATWEDEKIDKSLPGYEIEYNELREQIQCYD